MNLSRLDLNLLLVLDTVLSEGSVVNAARRLHLTPSAISNALARLRLALDDPLVARKGRGIVPTPRAAELAPSLKRALGEIERALQTDAFDPATTTRRFTLAIADAGQIARLPRLVGLLAKEMPHAQLRVVGIDTYVSSGGLASQEIDAAIIALEDNLPGIHTVPLYREGSLLVAGRQYSQAEKPITKRQLAEFKHVDVQVSPGHGFRGLDRIYARAGIERKVALVVPTFVAAAAVVAQTDLVATLPASLIDALAGPWGLSALRASIPKIQTQIKLAWHERSLNDQAMRAFREVVIKAVRQQRPNA